MVAVGLGLWMGCDTNAFLCSDDADCTWNGQDGVCEFSGYCSFSDETCDSGKRYGEFAGGSLGLTCVEFDEAGSSDGADPADGDPAPTEPPTPPNEPNLPADPECWRDGFDDASLDSTWCVETPPGIEASEAQGVLSFDLAPAQWEGGEQLGQILNCDPRPLHDMTVSTRVAYVPQVADAEAYFEVRGTGFGAGIGVTNGELYAFDQVDDDYQYHGEQPYDPEGHRHWRVRGSDEGLVTEVSADGHTWMHLHTYGVDLSDASGAVALGIWSEAAPPMADRAQYDWLEICGTPN